MTQPPRLRRIVVLLPNWVGDTLFATPLLRALRAAHPRAHLATLGMSLSLDVLAGNPHVDAMLVYDERGAHRSLRAKATLVRRLRAQHFDTAFILRRSFSRTLLLAISGIPARIGYDEGRGRRLLTHRVPPTETPVHRAESYLRLARAVGIAASAHRCDFVVGADHQQQADRWLAAQRPTGDARPLIVLNAGGNWPHKRWPEERFTQLAQRLQRELDAVVLLTGGPRDTALTKRIAAGITPAPLIAAGTDALQDVGALFARCALVVSNDSGPLHIVVALGVPLVALFGPTSPSLTGPFGRGPWSIIHHADGCPQVPCYTPDDPPHPGMSAISIEEVFAAVRQRLRGAQTPVAHD